MPPPPRRKLRLCWDGRLLNGQIQCPKFKMETVDVAARLMRPGDYMFVIDSKQDAALPGRRLLDGSPGAPCGYAPSLQYGRSESGVPPDPLEACVQAFLLF